MLCYKLMMKRLRCVLHNRPSQSMFSDVVESREPHPVKGGLWLRDIPPKDIAQTDQDGLELEIMQSPILHLHLYRRIDKSRPRSRQQQASMQ